MHKIHCIVQLLSDPNREFEIGFETSYLDVA